jgi:hypothetical protein
MAFFVSDNISSIVTEDLLAGSSDQSFSLLIDGKMLKVLPDEIERNFEEGWLRIKFKTSSPNLINLVNPREFELVCGGDTIGRLRSFRMTKRDDAAVCEILLADLNT